MQKKSPAPRCHQSSHSHGGPARVGRIRGDSVQSDFPSICFLQQRKGLMRSRYSRSRTSARLLLPKQRCSPHPPVPSEPWHGAFTLPGTPSPPFEPWHGAFTLPGIPSPPFEPWHGAFTLPGIPSPPFSLYTGLGLWVQILPLKFFNSLTQDKPLHLSENLFPHLSNGISNQSNIPGLL